MNKMEKIGKNGTIYKYKDLSGLKIGSYTILNRGKTIVRKTGQTVTWTAKCECGNINDLEYGNIMAAIKKFTNGSISIFSCGCKSSLPFGVSASKKVYRQYKVHAENRGYKFNLTFDEFLEIVKQECHYCGVQPKNKLGNVGKVSRGNGYFVYNGMDRMNNQIGYYLDNIVPCCKRCNRAKDVMGKNEFLEWVEKVYNHSFGEHELKKILRVA